MKALLPIALLLLIACKKDDPQRVDFYISCYDCTFTYTSSDGGSTTETTPRQVVRTATISPGTEVRVSVFDNMSDCPAYARITSNGTVLASNLGEATLEDFSIAGKVK